MPRYPQRIWLAAFLIAWAVDFLFWGKPVGISFLTFTILALATGFILARLEKASPARLSWVLGVAIILLACGTLIRSEPFSRFLNGFLALAGLALLARTFQSGGWMRYRIFHYLLMWVDLLLVMLSRAAGLRILPPENGEESSFRLFIRRLLPVVRGLLFALPVVVLLAGLLAAADLVFADQVKSFFELFNLDRLPEYLLRFFLILAMTYLMAGIYVQSLGFKDWFLRLPGDRRQPEDKKPSMAAASSSDAAPETSDATAALEAPDLPAVTNEAGALQTPAAEHKPANDMTTGFIGFTEAFVMLGSVNLLFLFFVSIQFRYLFGGHANITAAGYTFSEYARRGFFELVSVAVISLLLYLGLTAFTRRASIKQNSIFIGLLALLVVQVLIILASAFQRLLLYENAYGFTRLRLYTHIFIPWLGLLLLGVILLQIARRDRYFSALLLVAIFGFAVSFSVFNVDGQIARLNIERAKAGMELDGTYLISLSDDMLPALARAFKQPDLPKDAHDTLGAVLSCRSHTITQEDPRPWQSYHPGQAAARTALTQVRLAGYEIQMERGQAYVVLDQGSFYYYQPRIID